MTARRTRVGRVHADDEEAVKLCGGDAPLLVVLVVADAQVRGQRRRAGEYRRPGITQQRLPAMDLRDEQTAQCCATGIAAWTKPTSRS